MGKLRLKQVVACWHFRWIAPTYMHAGSHSHHQHNSPFSKPETTPDAAMHCTSYLDNQQPIYTTPHMLAGAAAAARLLVVTPGAPSPEEANSVTVALSADSSFTLAPLGPLTEPCKLAGRPTANQA
jgi:hypothetical protein